MKHPDQHRNRDLPVEIGDLTAIEGVLRDQDLLCTSFSNEDVYSAALYLQQAEIHKAHARMLLDRNVFARIVALAEGASAKQDHRVAAAVLAFAQCAGIDIEPGIALYEGVATQNENRAAHDLGMFRTADNLHPLEFVDIALGRSSKLRSKLAPGEVKADLTALTRPIRQYSFVYPLVLKLGLIELTGGPMEVRMCRFLDWAYSNWYLSAPVTAFAAICFSGAPPRDALKNLRNRDRSLVLRGLSNGAWDLTYVTWWGELLKRQDPESCLYLFCSCDKTLRRVARLLMTEPDSGEEDIVAALRQLLGPATCDYYVQLMERCDDPKRSANQAGDNPAERGPEIIAALEHELVQSL